MCRVGVPPGPGLGTTALGPVLGITGNYLGCPNLFLEGHCPAEISTNPY